MTQNPVIVEVKYDCWLQYYKRGDWQQRLTISKDGTKHVVICQDHPGRINGIEAGKWTVLHEFRRPESVVFDGIPPTINWGPWTKGVKGVTSTDAWKSEALFDDGINEGDEDYNDAVVQFIYKEDF